MAVQNNRRLIDSLNTLDVSALSLLRVSHIYYSVTYVYRAELQRLSAALLKRQTTTPLWEMNLRCRRELAGRVWKTTKHLSDAKARKFQHRLECASGHCESWDIQAIPAQFFLFCFVCLGYFRYFKVFLIIANGYKLHSIAICGLCSWQKLCVTFSAMLQNRTCHTHTKKQWNILLTYEHEHLKPWEGPFLQYFQNNKF